MKQKIGINKLTLLMIFASTSLTALSDADSLTSLADSLNTAGALQPVDIKQLSRWNNGPVFASAVSENYMFYSSSGTLRVVELKKDLNGHPVEWTPISSFETSGVIRDMIAFGETIYLADNSGWLHIVDISNPQQLQEISKVHLNSRARAIAVENNYVYVASQWEGVQIIDVSFKREPKLLNSVKAGYALDVSIVDSIAVVAGGLKGMFVLDLRDPLNPVQLAERDISGSVSGAEYHNGHIYLVNMDDSNPRLFIFDLSDTSNPTKIAEAPLEYGAERVRIEGNLAYVAGVANDAGLIVFDVTDPAKPTQLGSWWHPTCSESVAIDNNFAYLAHGDQGLEIIDIRNSAKPTVVGHFSAAGHARGVEVDNDLIYLANGYRGLKVLKRKGKQTPEFVAEELTYRAMDVALTGSYLHIADEWAGYKLFDVSNPKAPKLVGKLDTPGYAEGIDNAGDLVFIADGQAGLRILDVSSHFSPREISHLDTSGYARQVQVKGHNLFLADGKSGLLVVDISNPIGPVAVGSYLGEGNYEALDVFVLGNYAFVAGGYYGLSVLDISDLTAIKEIAKLKTSAKATDIDIVGNRAYLINSNKMLAIDISTPSSPKLISEHDLPASADKIRADKNGIYVAGMEAGLLVFDTEAE